MLNNYTGSSEEFKALVEIVGESKAEIIIDTFGGSYIYIPMKKTLSKEDRDIQIYNDFLSGLSFRKIALKYNVSENTARKIIRDMK